ncbi:tRNA (N(6)-L-threonylcarbamoyladenosine(37)-C(2))-methylthiotransferase [Methanolobus sp.]|jgi:threonylcarbamoyladenosine tRNA methylthiotransferase CDKAL1|uniref:tRNA (N(6)-L-threonylcarbamoyladenosine(37)-C(2))- methylthiotransferase n=1 Tax=Methanolobus sp. TaxID=1874737 RepID=UPI0025FD9F90|nr:tRNA (N(6)-L-threonylcarbamoyladenosine(37)-C(2))-methylthiotransferase [Methanolobus sp.]
MKVHISTYGCSASQASAEIMKASVRDSGHELVSEKDADVVVINTCTVKYTTEQKILHKIREFGEKGTTVIVSGCMPEVQLDVIMHQNPNAHILGVNSISRLGQMLNSLDSSQSSLKVFLEDPEGFQVVPRIRFNSNIHICQLSQGCNYSCAYCIVTIARGSLRSFEPEEIVEDISRAVNEGCREIWLTSQDNGQYGTDKEILLPQLLDMICRIPGKFKIRVGMMNPFSVTPILDDLLDAFESEKIYKLLHLPIQSASDDVLHSMNRYHSISEANNIIDNFRSRFPDMTLFTDIIVGYPGETDKDFKKTVEWVKEYKPEKVNISRFTPRPHTKAWDLRKIDSRIVVKRSNELHDVCETVKLDSRDGMIGRELDVFLSKPAKQKGMMARTDSYKPVVIPECEVQPGITCRVQIYDTTPGYFLGRIVSQG